MFSQLIQPYLFNLFNNKIHLLFCNNTSKPQVPFMYNHYVPLIIFYENAKNKAIRKHKLPSHSTSNLKYKKPCGQSSIKAIYKGLPGKKDKLNIIMERSHWKFIAHFIIITMVTIIL